MTADIFTIILIDTTYMSILHKNFCITSLNKTLIYMKSKLIEVVIKTISYFLAALAGAIAPTVL